MGAFAATVSGRRSWIFLVLGLLLAGVVLGTAKAGSDQAPNSLPADAESAQVTQLLTQFPDGDVAPAIVVFSRSDGAALTGADLAAAKGAYDRAMAVDRGVAETAATTAGKGGPPPVIPSQDGKAAISTVPVTTAQTGLDLSDTVAQLRTATSTGLPAGLNAQVTGGPGFAADIAGAFAGADIRLLASTAAVVAVLLLLTYRSPVLWLVPLLVVAVSDRVGTVLASLVGSAFGFSLDGSTTGITSVLVFGAGTNYALLIVSRYREELRREPDHRVALARAVRHAGPAVLASNITVVLALLTLLLATLPNTRVLGLSGAVGLLVAVTFALVVLPPCLALAGRRLFRPFVPKVGDPDPSVRGGWHRVASFVARRPVAVLATTLPLLALCCAGFLGVKVGLDQTDQFRVQAQSVSGYDTVRAHFPSGESNPTTVVARTDAAAGVQQAISGTTGVVRTQPTGTSDTGLTRWQVVLDAAPGTDEAFDTVQALRDSVHAVPGANALVGGTDAQQYDSRTAATHDLRLLVPLILGVVLAVLFVLLRALVAPLLLIVATTLSALAALGAGAWFGIHVLGFPALADSVPLFAFLFLVALGVDYTIFLVVRAREETPEHGTRDGIVRAVALTGGVITSAGIVLAAVFAVLGVLPLITLTQLGIVVGLGILLDTFLVRTVVIPAVFTLVGRRVWWPAALSRAGE